MSAPPLCPLCEALTMVVRIPDSGGLRSYWCGTIVDEPGEVQLVGKVCAEATKRP